MSLRLRALTSLALLVLTGACSAPGDEAPPRQAGGTSAVGTRRDPLGVAAALTATQHPRARAAVTLLPDGDVLVTGGCNGPGAADPTAEVFHVRTGQWELLAATMASPRVRHSATMLRDGRVLVVGGLATEGDPASVVTDAELFDPATGTFSPVSGAIARYDHAATLLPQGTVLLVGSGDAADPAASSPQLFDPTGAAFSGAGSPPAALVRPAIAQLPGPSALVVGEGGQAALYASDSGGWTPVTPKGGPWTSPVATFVPAGPVLITGSGASDAGVFSIVNETFANPLSLSPSADQPSLVVLPSGVAVLGGDGGAVRFFTPTTPTSGTFSSQSVGLQTHGAGRLSLVLPTGHALFVGGDGTASTVSEVRDFTPKWGSEFAFNLGVVDFSATVLASGEILVAGGAKPASSASSNAFLVSNGASPALAATTPMKTARARHTGTQLRSGKVLVVGGVMPQQPSAEVFDPVSQGWTDVPIQDVPRDGHTATLLRDGRVLLAGGGPTNSPTPEGSIAVYDPKTESVAPLASASLATERRDHTATRVPDGRVVIAGGGRNGVELASVEIFDPATDTVTPGPPLSGTRASHAALLLPGGQVLLLRGSLKTGAKDLEIYDPDAGTLWSANLPPGAMGPMAPAAVVLLDGRVLIAGFGLSTTSYVFDPITKAVETGPTLAGPHDRAVARFLRSGKVILGAGLAGGGGTLSTTASLFDEGRIGGGTKVPTLDPLPTSLPLGTLDLSGNLGAPDGGSGTAQGPAANMPIVQIEHPESGQRWTARTTAWSAGMQATASVTLPDLPLGNYWARVVVAGVPSDAQTLAVKLPDAATCSANDECASAVCTAGTCGTGAGGSGGGGAGGAGGGGAAGEAGAGGAGAGGAGAGGAGAGGAGAGGAGAGGAGAGGAGAAGAGGGGAGGGGAGGAGAGGAAGAGGGAGQAGGGAAGTAGTGGSGGTAGAAAGAAGAAGTAGKAGSSGSAGSASGAGGAHGGASGGAVAANEEEEGGGSFRSCAVAAPGSDGRVAWLSGVALAFALAQRRRRR